jgi:hypothetical protein
MVSLVDGYGGGGGGFSGLSFDYLEQAAELFGDGLESGGLLGKGSIVF